MPSKWRITVYVPEATQKAIERRAASENRSISNLAATIIIKAMEEHEKQKDSQESDSGSP